MTKPTQTTDERLKDVWARFNRDKQIEVETIERCAQVAETFHCALCGADAAAAIRALKEKPAIDPNLVYPGKDPNLVFPEE